MFSIGVEFSIPELMRVKRVAIVGGPIGILLMLGAQLDGESWWVGAQRKAW
jgi:Kef-type K+ transport system membrane component KefB